MDEAGWTVGIAVDKDAILEAENKSARITVSISIVLLCAGIAVSLIIANSIAKPIMKTQTIADNISNLELNIDIDDKSLKRKMKR